MKIESLNIAQKIFPSSPTFMQRATTKKMLRGTILATAVVTLVFCTAMSVFRSRISEAFGPMERSELVCLICHRDRVTKWVCGSKVRDDISANQYSEWIDTFTPLDHKHVWCGHTHYGRSRWFGGTTIGCGGITTIPRIFESRSRLGESDSQKLASSFHALVAGQSPESELYHFESTVVGGARSLLASDNSN